MNVRIIDLICDIEVIKEKFEDLKVRMVGLFQKRFRIIN